MKTLTHREQVKMAQFKYSPEVRVGTIEGYCVEENIKYGNKPGDQYFMDIEAQVAQTIERAKKDSANVLAWTLRSCSVLTADYKGKDEEMVQKRLNYENATVLVAGEEVMIEGRKYTVRLNGIDCSDPISFMPVK